MKDTNQITARIEAAERELAEAKRQLAEATKPEVARYEPMEGGPYMERIYGDSRTFVAASGSMSKPGLGAQGREYRAVEAAQASADIINWMMHLLNLAAQLNPSGKAGGDVCLEWAGGRWRYRTASLPPQYWQALSLPLFENQEAANTAVEILKSSNGELAGVKCPFI